MRLAFFVLIRYNDGDKHNNDNNNNNNNNNNKMFDFYFRDRKNDKRRNDI